MGRGSKEGSGQKTRGERQQLQKEERHIHRVTAEVGLGAEPHPQPDSPLWSGLLGEPWGAPHCPPFPFPEPHTPRAPVSWLPGVPPRTYPAAFPTPLPLALVPGVTDSRGAPSSKTEPLARTPPPSLKQVLQDLSHAPHRLFLPFPATGFNNLDNR